MTRQNTKLLLMFLFGLPALPIVCLFWLMDRYIIAYDQPPEKRITHSKEGFISVMCAFTGTGLLFWGVWLLCESCK